MSPNLTKKEYLQVRIIITKIYNMKNIIINCGELIVLGVLLILTSPIIIAAGIMVLLKRI